MPRALGPEPLRINWLSMSETTNFQPVHAADIQAAQARISSVIEPTPLQYCPRLSQQYGVEVYLKREDLSTLR